MRLGRIFARAPLLTALTLLALAASAVGVCAEKAYSRFDYCAPPYPPPCAAKLQDASEAKLKACEAEVERYVATVFAYRGCVAAETERAVREANSTIQAVRCARSPEACSQPEPEPEAPAPKPKKDGKKR